MLTSRFFQVVCAPIEFMAGRIVAAQRLAGCFAWLLIAGVSFAQNASTDVSSREDDNVPVALPKMTIAIDKLKPQLLVPKRDLTGGDFKGGIFEPVFPHRARHENVVEGFATIGLMIDAKGKATDFLILKYTKRYFADALLSAFRNQAFTPRRVKGVAVPGRVGIGQKFSDPFPTQVLLLDVAVDRMFKPALPQYIYRPRNESETDSKMLQFTAVSVPVMPHDYEVQDGTPVTVVVSFYVDEQGNVRLPNVDSNSSPLLTPSVLEAVSRWKFVPPTIKGNPVLVFAIRSVILDPAAPKVSAVSQDALKAEK